MLKIRPRYLSRREWRAGDIFKIHFLYIKSEIQNVLIFINTLRSVSNDIYLISEEQASAIPKSFNATRVITEPC